MHEPKQSETPETDAVDADQKPRSWEVSYWNMRAHARKMERERDAHRDALKQIVHNPGWQDPELGFMSGHIAAGVLNQFPENATILAPPTQTSNDT